MFIGRVRSLMTGFIKMLMKAKTMTAMNAPVQLVLTPGTKYEVIIMATVDTKK